MYLSKPINQLFYVLELHKSQYLHERGASADAVPKAIQNLMKRNLHPDAVSMGFLFCIYSVIRFGTEVSVS